jgi:hypothetical protein
MKTTRRRLLVTLVLAAALLAVLAGGVYAALTAIERDAVRLAESGQQAMRFLGSYAKALEAGDVPALEALYHPDAVAPRGLWTEEPPSERDGIRVHALTAAPAPGIHLAAMPGRGDGAALAHWLAALVARLGEVESAKLKLARVERATRDALTVRTVLWVRGSRGAERYETQARLRLELVGRKGAWRIRSQELIDGTTVSGPGDGFVEVAEAAGLRFRARSNPLFETPEWFPHQFEIIRYGAAGVAVGDYDGDEWEDVFFADGAAARLFRNRGDGTFEDATRAAGLPEALGGVNVALFADFDNDGDRDLFLGVFTGPNRLLRNEGDGTFVDVTEGAGLGGLMVTTASAADYDRDGRLDLYVGRYLDPRTELPDTMFYTRNGAGNSLLRNLGDLRFADVTERAGVREGGLTLGVAWADYDADGFDDLYVANDFGRNALLRNRGDGTFADVTAETGTLDFGFGMSAAWGDVDGDGDFDIYVSNIHSGQRWYGQAPSLKQYLLNSIRQRTLPADLSLYREIYGLIGPQWQHYGDGMVKGNSLLLNNGNGAFTEVAEAANANPFGWYWGSGFLDFDHDGQLDVFAANGWITAPLPDDL